MQKLFGFLSILACLVAMISFPDTTWNYKVVCAISLLTVFFSLENFKGFWSFGVNLILTTCAVKLLYVAPPLPYKLAYYPSVFMGVLVLLNVVQSLKEEFSK